MNEKKNAYWVDADELVQGWHFEVVTDTPFDTERVDHFYELPNHTIDYDLATTLGLGVVKNLLVKDDYYLYNASNDQPDHFGMMHEVTQMGVYYQITHPDYDDRGLEDLIIDTKGGKEFL